MANVINATSTGSGGLISTGDDSGILNIQTNETTALSIDASQNVTFTNAANLPNTFGFKNRIINGRMEIDQRNAGAAVTVNNSASNVFSVDRWQGAGETSDGVFTLQRSTTVPANFINSLVATVTTADASIGTSQRYLVQQRIEGLNVADLNWGSANARTVTISFWVRSSVTGTFGGALRNSAGDRSYPFTYSISSANTWEQKSVTVAGDTTGTWLTTNGIGVYLTFAIGVGSSLKGTAGAWAATNYWSATGAVDLISTLNATWYITGVQLELGSAATAFDFRSYGTELALCQRYYTYNGNATTDILGTGNGYLGNTQYFKQTMRIAPNMTNTVLGGGGYTGFTIDQIGTDSFRAYASANGGAGATANVQFSWTASAEL